MSEDASKPPVWQPELDELERRRRFAEGLGGPEAVARHQEGGCHTVRGRIERLVDSGSFQEVGKLAGRGEYDDRNRLVKVTPAPYVMGLAAIDGRAVAVGGEDFTVRGGTGGTGERRKGGQGGFVEDLALQYRIPLVNFCDGAGGSVASARRRGYTVFPGVDGFETSVALLGQAPVVCAVT
ncbi:MAG: carboxyl transferase domain-containing protein, partial [Chloroflexota bacterium]